MARRKKDVLHDLLAASDADAVAASEAIPALHALYGSAVEKKQRRISEPRRFESSTKGRISIRISSRAAALLQQVEEAAQGLLGWEIDRQCLIDCALQTVFEELTAKKKKSTLVRKLLSEKTLGSRFNFGDYK